MTLATVLIAFGIMLTTVAAMAIGVIFGRKPIAGSCGGMKALGMDMACEICGGSPQFCESVSDENFTEAVSEAASGGESRAGIHSH